LGWHERKWFRPECRRILLYSKIRRAGCSGCYRLYSGAALSIISGFEIAPQP
jgi:hypothetical protein